MEPIKPTNSIPKMIPSVGKHMTTTWLLRNYEVVNERIWDPHYELSLFHLYDQSIPINSLFHKPYLPEVTREFLRSKRILTIPYYGSGLFVLHFEAYEDEIEMIKSYMAALYSSQLEAKGRITPEFRQYCIRKVAISTNGRTGMDMARLWDDLVKNNFKIPIEKKFIVAVRCHESPVPPDFQTGVYSIHYREPINEGQFVLNGDYLCAINTKFMMLSLYDVTTGDSKKYLVPSIYLTAPIRTGGFFFAMNDGIICSVNGTNNFSKGTKIQHNVAKLIPSAGLQPVFAAIDSTYQYITYGTIEKNYSIDLGTPGSNFDVYNKRLFASLYIVANNTSFVKMFDFGKFVSEWEFQGKIIKIKYIECIKKVGVLSDFGLFLIDPRCTLEAFQLIQCSDASDFLISPIKNHICLYRKSFIDIYDPKCGKKLVSLSMKPEPCKFIIKWMKNDEILVFFTDAGSALFVYPELERPVIETVMIHRGEPLEIYTEMDKVLLISKDEATMIVMNKNRRLFVPELI